MELEGNRVRRAVRTNMPVFTLATSHPDRPVPRKAPGWKLELHDWNMYGMLATLPVSQPPKSVPNAIASLNRYAMVVTIDTCDQKVKMLAAAGARGPRFVARAAHPMNSGRC